MGIKPVYLDFGSYSVCALAGISGSGKTSTARFILAQLALDGYGLVICDPHGSLPRETLTAASKALDKVLMKPVAITKQEILESIFYVESIFLSRINGEDDTSLKVALIIDEVTNFFLSCTQEEIIRCANFFLRLANESRKIDIRVFLLSQNWKADYVGSASVRSSINAILFHRISEQEVKLFVPSAPAQLRKTIASLKQGHVIIKSLEHEFVEVAVPFVSLEDLETIRSQIPAIQIGRRAMDRGGLKNASLRNPEIINTSAYIEENMDTKKQILLEKAKRIVELRRTGKTKNIILSEVFSVKPGATTKYKAASKFYDLVMSRYDLL
jgi:ABC-type oligopeptide transport system ATPase subunit